MLALMAVLATACGSGSTTRDVPRHSNSESTCETTAETTTETTSVSNTSRGPVTTETVDHTENHMKIQITIGDRRFTATLTDSAAARDLAAQLPVTVEMADHGGVEKTGPLPSPLSLEGQPEGADPDPGDVGYYAPGNDLVFYYGDQSYFPGIVILGRLNGDAAERIARINGSVTATIEAR